MPEVQAPFVLDGFWLPSGILESWFSNVVFAQQTFAQGRPAHPGAPGSVTVRWPVLGPREYASLTNILFENKRNVPEGEEFWPRFRTALQHATRRLADPTDALHQQALAALPGYTGYSSQMIAIALSAMDWFSLERLPKAFCHPPSADAIQAWQPLIGRPGWICFFPQAARPSLATRLHLIARRSTPSKRTLYKGVERTQKVVGYGAGNVPGAALLIGLLAQSVVLGGEKPPAVLLRNSRREPIFTPLVLRAMEEIDPDLIGAMAVMVWDYEDQAVQSQVLGWADTVIAAAGDETIHQIREALQRAGSSDPARFQPHGHKVSFAFIGREMAAQGSKLLEQAARLAALDSVFWDQNGCISARVHFVEQNMAPTQAAQDNGQAYAERLTGALRRLATTLPRGAWPRRELHERFDRYKSLEAAGLAQVFSNYDDDFLVFIDHRPWDEPTFRWVVNDCQGRTIAIRPVQDRMQIPDNYLRHLPPANLQSLSVAVGQPGQSVGEDFLRFAQACALRGITAIRSVGRGAFPQLAYSWDGYIPYDLVAHRGEGRFCTIEFDAPYDEMLATFGIADGIHKTAD